MARNTNIPADDEKRGPTSGVGPMVAIGATATAGLRPSQSEDDAPRRTALVTLVRLLARQAARDLVTGRAKANAALDCNDLAQASQSHNGSVRAKGGTNDAGKPQP